MSKKHIQPINHPCKKLIIKWLSDKYGNFTKDKLYVATPRWQRTGDEHLWSGFQITDDEGDRVSLDACDQDKKWTIYRPTKEEPITDTSGSMTP